MATDIGTLPEQHTRRELDIELNTHLSTVQYTGTKAQLEDEGLIPEEFKWPRGATDLRWSANGFDYWLRRVRPAGHKGPRRTWVELDSWCIRVEVSGRDYAWRIRNERERNLNALQAAFDRLVDPNRFEAQTIATRRYWAAYGDKAFQAIMAAIIPRASRRGRKPAGHQGSDVGSV